MIKNPANFFVFQIFKRFIQCYEQINVWNLSINFLSEIFTEYSTKTIPFHSVSGLPADHHSDSGNSETIRPQTQGHAVGRHRTAVPEHPVEIRFIP